MIEQEHLIDLQQIGKDYDGVTVLDDINLYIRKKEFVTLLGPSGCGKTTTLRIIAGFETPSRGRLLFEGGFAVVVNGHVQFADAQADAQPGHRVHR